ncbi:hypothetical protein DASC09_012480 [Saccharomycopsis crataegensis]|uniref:Uncharacterized protein n=1 Tax=Saccharomycopsis crataegensis TaxID=43959 RepID=A0AAV5QGN7_9ASCO|nr:hypothetical protein DASC09_012480 [Saccharomycopsis crataegensis]
MSSDTLGASINKLIRDRNRRRASSVSNHQLPLQLVLKRLAIRLINAKIFRVIVVSIVFLILAMKNSEKIYYKSLDIFDPIHVSEPSKLFNSGIDMCEKYSLISDDGKSLYDYSKTKSRVMDPEFEVITYEDLYHNSNRNKDSVDENSDSPNSTVAAGSVKDSFFFAALLEDSTVQNFKSLVNRLSKVDIDGSLITVAVLLQDSNVDDGSIEAFLDNYFRLSDTNVRNFRKFILINQYSEQLQSGNSRESKNDGGGLTNNQRLSQEVKLSNLRNFLVNTGMTTERYLISLINWNGFDPVAFSALKPDIASTKQKILVGYEPKGNTEEDDDDDHHDPPGSSPFTVQFVAMKSVIFNQGIQFNRILLNGNSWTRGELAAGLLTEVENLCYQADAIGISCNFVSV